MDPFVTCSKDKPVRIICEGDPYYEGWRGTVSEPIFAGTTKVRCEFACLREGAVVQTQCTLSRSLLRVLEDADTTMRPNLQPWLGRKVVVKQPEALAGLSGEIVACNPGFRVKLRLARPHQKKRFVTIPCKTASAFY